jgi:tetratricopeptide (TPR) repeat protein
MALSLSLCMIVRNEEHNLERCLRSVQGVVDEIIIVDTGSTDRTPEIAARYGAKVFHHVWQDDFALARNASLKQAAGDWILALDADEELAPDTQARLRSVLSATTADGLLVCQRNFFSAKALASYGDVNYVRLFRNRPGVGYELALHEQITPSILRQNGRLETSDLVIWHYGYTQPVVQGQEGRFQRNIRVLEQELARSPQSAFLCASLGLVYHQVKQAALAEAYLRRALELGAEALPAEMLAEILFTRAQIGRQNGQLPLAIQCAQASVDLGGPGMLNALNFLAQAHWQSGEQALQAAQQAMPAQAVSADEALAQRQAGQTHLQQARLAFERAHEAFSRLRQHPLLNPAAAPEVDEALDHCRALVRSMAACLWAA